MSGELGRLSTQGRVIQQLFQAFGGALARWTHLDYQGPDEPVSPPALLVANHGFGGIFDTNVFTVATIAGHTGYARLAIETGAPIVPIVMSGAGDTLLVLSDGQDLARRLHLPSLVRMKTLPVSVSFPWGLSVGAAGMLLPDLPVPAKMRAAVLDPVSPAPGEDASALAQRVETAMSDKLTSMTEGRVPVLGMRWDQLFGGPP